MSLRTLTLLVLIITGAIFLTCSENNSSPTEPQLSTVPEILTVTPSSGVPGTILNVSGLTIDSASIQQYTAFLGGEQVPLRRAGDSLLMVAIPLFYDTTISWSNPPAGPVNLEISKNEKPIAKSINGVTVDSLPHASGTTARIRDLIDTLASNLGIILASAPVNYVWEQELRDSVISMLHNLASGGDSSLSAVIDGTSPLLNGASPDIELTDALMASTGALSYWEDLVGGISAASGRMQQAIASSQERGILCRAGGPDVDLACKMQLYVILKNFEKEFLSQTSQEWDLIGGTIFGTLGYTALAAELPLLAAEVVGITLTLADFILKNQALSLLPSRIVAFDVYLAVDSVDVDQHTTSEVKIMAMNSPATVTLNELIDVITAGLSFAIPPNMKPTLNLFLVDLARFVLDRLRAALVWLSANYPELNVDLSDPAVYTFPLIQYGPVLVEEPDLVRLVSYDESIARVDESMFEWEGLSRGTVEIQAQSRGPGERSKVIREWFCLCQYTGGAFGEDAATSGLYDLIVGRPGELEVTIDGLPGGLDADVLVIYPDGVTFKHLTATETISGLEPGEYNVQAYERTTSEGTVYFPDQDSQIALVRGNSTTSVSVHYKSQFGNMLLTVSGLSPATDADITVQGPNGELFFIVNDTLIDSLLEGNYTILANEVFDATTNKTLSPVPLTQDIIVTAGETALANVNYKSRYGTIKVNVRMRSGLQADIDIEGDSLTRHVTNSTIITDVYAGTYSIIAYDVPLDSFTTLKAIPAAQAVIVTGGDTAQVDVKYSAPLQITWSYGPSDNPLGRVKARSFVDSLAIDTLTIDEQLGPPGYVVNEHCAIVGPPSGSAAASGSATTAYSNGRASFNISAGGPSATINVDISARASVAVSDSGSADCASDIGFGDAGNFDLNNKVYPSDALASGLHLQIYNPALDTFSVSVMYQFNVSSDDSLLKLYGEEALSFRILYQRIEYTSKDYNQFCGLSFYLQDSSCTGSSNIDCWRGGEFFNETRRGEGIENFSLFLMARFSAKANSYEVPRNATLTGTITINVLQ